MRCPCFAKWRRTPTKTSRTPQPVPRGACRPRAAASSRGRELGDVATVAGRDGDERKAPTRPLRSTRPLLRDAAAAAVRARAVEARTSLRITAGGVRLARSPSRVRFVTTAAAVVALHLAAAVRPAA